MEQVSPCHGSPGTSAIKPHFPDRSALARAPTQVRRSSTWGAHSRRWGRNCRDSAQIGQEVPERPHRSLELELATGERAYRAAEVRGYQSFTVRGWPGGGALHMAEMDKPETKREGYFLKIAGSVVPTESLAPHLDGTWVATLSKAGFVGIRRLSSHSLTTARVLVLRARRQ